MTRAKQRKNDGSVVWILDESISQDKTKWSTLGGNVKSLKELNLLSTKDAVISETLDTIFPNGKVVITANKRPDKQDDYFKTSPIQGIVKFSSDIQKHSDQNVYLGKFQQTVKNKTKLLGAEITLTKRSVVYKKGSKTKTVIYKNYI